MWIPLPWLALALIDASQTVATMFSEGMHHNWALLFSVWAMGWLPWIPATVLILWIDRRFPFRAGRWTAPLAAHATAGTIIALAATAWQSLLCVAFNATNEVPAPTFVPQWTGSLGSGALSTIILYAIVLLAKNALDTRELVSAQSQEQPRAAARIAIKSIGGVEFVRVADIDWIEAADYYSRLHAGGRSHLLRRSMADLEGDLRHASFCRIHRSTIVNVERVQNLKLNEDGEHDVLLADGTTLRVSRRYRRTLQTRLGEGRPTQ